MKKIALALTLLIVTLCSFAQAQRGRPLSFGAPCPAVTYPASPLYQSLTFSDWSINAGLASFQTNQLPAPNCTNTAATMQEDTSNGSHDINKDLTLTLGAGQVVNITFYAWDFVGTRQFGITFYDTSFGSNANFLWQANCTNGFTGVNPPTGGAFTASSQNGTLMSTPAGSVCKLTAQFTVGPGYSTTSHMRLTMASSFSQFYTGDGVSTNAIWGFDLR